MPRGRISGKPNELPSVGQEFRILRTPDRPVIVVTAVRYDDHRKEHRISYRFKLPRSAAAGSRMNGSCWYESGFRRPSCYAPVAQPTEPTQAASAEPVQERPRTERIEVEVDMTKMTKTIARFSGDIAALEKTLDRLVALGERQVELLEQIKQIYS